MSNLKKILLILGFVAVSVGVGAAIYIVFFAPAAEPPETTRPPVVGEPGAALPPSGIAQPPTTGVVAPSAGLPPTETAQGGVTKTIALTSSRVQSASLSADGAGVNFYDSSDNRFYKVNIAGVVQKLADQKFPEVENVEWSANGEKAIIEFPDSSNIIYNFATGNQVTLPKHWEDFSFSPDGKQIISKSMGVDSENRWLVVANDDGSNVKPIAALGNNADKVQISWSPNEQIIAFSDTGDNAGGFGRRMLIPIGKNSENLKGLIIDGFQFTPSWSPRGDKLLYSVAASGNNFKPMLWVVDGSASNIGSNRRELGIETTADKCVFANNTTLYCAVPSNLPNLSGIQPELARNTTDNIYSIDISSGTKSLVAIPDVEQQISDLSISADGTNLFFTNKVNGILETIKIQ